jgi:phage major head subunit gpT-like protein
MQINASTLSALFTGFKVIFNKAFEGTPSDWEKLAMVVPSSTSQEVYAWLGTITGFSKWAGDRVIQNLKTHDFTIKNESFENTVGVNRDKIDDDNYGVYNPMIAQLGQDAKSHPDELIFALLKAGFSTPCYDGQNFFDTDHPVIQKDGSVTSVSNMAAGASAPWFLVDVSRAIKPLIFQRRKNYTFTAMNKDTDTNVFMRKEYIYGVDARCNVGFGLWQLAYGSKEVLNKDSYKAARTALMEMKGDNGKPLGVRPTLLVVSPVNEGAGLEVLKAERDAQGATNVYQNTAELLTTPWLA